VTVSGRRRRQLPGLTAGPVFLPSVPPSTRVGLLRIQAIATRIFGLGAPGFPGVVVAPWRSHASGTYGLRKNARIEPIAACCAEHAIVDTCHGISVAETQHSAPAPPTAAQLETVIEHSPRSHVVQHDIAG